MLNSFFVSNIVNKDCRSLKFLGKGECCWKVGNGKNVSMYRQRRLYECRKRLKLLEKEGIIENYITLERC